MANGNKTSVGSNYPDDVALLDALVNGLDGTRENPRMKAQQALLLTAS